MTYETPSSYATLAPQLPVHLCGSHGRFGSKLNNDSSLSPSGRACLRITAWDCGWRVGGCDGAHALAGHLAGECYCLSARSDSVAVEHARWWLVVARQTRCGPFDARLNFFAFPTGGMSAGGTEGVPPDFFVLPNILTYSIPARRLLNFRSELVLDYKRCLERLEDYAYEILPCGISLRSCSAVQPARICRAAERAVNSRDQFLERHFRRAE
jgi:hypothetical protein